MDVLNQGCMSTVSTVKTGDRCKTSSVALAAEGTADSKNQPNMWGPVYASYKYYEAQVAVLMATVSGTSCTAKQTAYNTLLTNYGKLKSDRAWASAYETAVTKYAK